LLSTFFAGAPVARAGGAADEGAGFFVELPGDGGLVPPADVVTGGGAVGDSYAGVDGGADVAPPLGGRTAAGPGGDGMGATRGGDRKSPSKSM
jgi:hypothetical protein